jgi:hypothetical protein
MRGGKMMKKMLPSILTLAGVTLLFASVSVADVPAPPVNQTIGIDDVSLGDLSEADCRICHDSAIPERHHMLYGQPIPPGSVVPFPDTDGDGVPDDVYSCLSCHPEDNTGGIISFIVVRDCTVCHTTSPHHTTPAAQAGDCVSCHGDIVDNMDDGHYIPVYAPSLVTPSPSGGAGLPLNSRGNGAGACDYCHDDDGLTTPVILTNEELHHNTGLDIDPTQCLWCHQDTTPPTDEFDIRTCEGCHGPDSLHNIQADSPNPDNIGTLVVGSEDAGYGHVGRDAGAGDSDCWGCHGFSMGSASGAGPGVPSITTSDTALLVAGTGVQVTLTGSAFTSILGTTQYSSDVLLTAADGSGTTLTPDSITEGSLTVTIPGTTEPGNYTLRAVKDGEASNPAAIIIKPQVVITEIECSKCLGTMTITGSGFSEKPDGTDEDLYVIEGEGSRLLKVISWTDTEIKVHDARCRGDVTVNALFGSDIQ